MIAAGAFLIEAHVEVILPAGLNLRVKIQPYILHHVIHICLPCQKQRRRQTHLCQKILPASPPGSQKADKLHPQNCHDHNIPAGLQKPSCRAAYHGKRHKHILLSNPLSIPIAEIEINTHNGKSHAVGVRVGRYLPGRYPRQGQIQQKG